MRAHQIKKITIFFCLLTERFGAPNSNPGQSVWGFMVDKWHCYKIFPEYLGFHISIILHLLHSHILFVYVSRSECRTNLWYEDW